MNPLEGEPSPFRAGRRSGEETPKGAVYVRVCLCHNPCPQVPEDSGGIPRLRVWAEGSVRALPLTNGVGWRNGSLGTKK